MEVNEPREDMAADEVNIGDDGGEPASTGGVCSAFLTEFLIT